MNLTQIIYNMKHVMKKLVLMSLFFAFIATYAQDKRSLNNYREPGKAGINVFEAPKDTATVAFDGVKVRIGGASTMQFQALSHENDGTIALKEIGSNFNLPTANLDLDVQLADGIRMHLRTYLSARHHVEAWVKGGYIQIDNLNFLGEGTLSEMMKYVTIKVGQMENNYGDMHFRRSDNAQAIYNPFVGNAIMDAFTTEVGGEIYYRNNGWLAMLGITNGKLNQGVNNPDVTSPSFLAKLGWDKQVNEDLRVRLTGSLYNTAHSSRTYLYGGDRAGSRYYFVMEDVEAKADRPFTSGRFNPGFGSQLTAIQFNPFVKFKGMEFFGIYEIADGYTGTVTGEKPSRSFTQIMAEALYRFGTNENFYLGARYNTVSGELETGDDISINRYSFGAGFFITENVLAKVEYVKQEYNDYPEGDQLRDGKFDGVSVEAIISF